MYLYFIVSTVVFMYCAIKLLTNKSKIRVLSVVGVDEDGRHHAIDDGSNLDDYCYFKTSYMFKNEKYCVVSEDVPRVDDKIDDDARANRSVRTATMRVNDMEIDMTEQVRQIAGPLCDFHDELIDFNWIFDRCVGTLVVDFTDATVEIDVDSNTIKSGPTDIIPMIEYVDIHSEIELD